MCGIRKADSAAQCWGQLPVEITSPVAVPPDTGALRGGFIEVAAGDRHVCGLRPGAEDSEEEGLVPAGGVVCWGDNSDGQTSVPELFRGFEASSGEKAVMIAAGSAHSCALLSKSAAWCWGANGEGQAPTSSELSLRAGHVTAGSAHSCVTITGRPREAPVVCAGRQPGGQSPPADELAVIEAGADHAGGLAAVPGEVRCWGASGDSGKRSDGRLDAPAGEFDEVSVGGKHACALTTLKEVRCRGDDRDRQAPRSSVGRLSSLSLTVRGVDFLAGRLDPDVLTYEVTAASGPATLRAEVGWGDGSRSRIVVSNDGGGESFLISNSEPVLLTGRQVFEVRVAGIEGLAERRVYQVVVNSPDIPLLDSLRLAPSGSGPHCLPGCAALALSPRFDPLVTRYRAWASSETSELTVGHSSSSGTVTVSPADSDGSTKGHQLRLDIASGFVSLSAGWYSACGVKASGSVHCWGDAGHASTGQSKPPAGTFASVSAGSWHSCGVKTDASAVCRGSNGYGQRSAPSGSFASVSTGSAHSCGLRTPAATRPTPPRR